MPRRVHTVPLASFDRSSPLISGMLRGFFVYLVLHAGFLLVDERPLSEPAPFSYMRLAEILSLLRCVINYNPSVFGRLLASVSDRATRQASDDGRGRCCS